MNPLRNFIPIAFICSMVTIFSLLPTEMAAFSSNRPSQAQQQARLKRLIQAGGISQDVAVQGSRVYFGDGVGLIVADASAPELVGLERITLPDVVEEIQLTDTHAYVSTGSAVQIVDIADPHTLRLISSYKAITEVNDLAVGQMSLYLATDAGLEIVDIRQPAQPAHQSILSEVGKLGRIDVFGSHAYVSSGGSHDLYHDKLQIVDITDPQAPQLRGTFDLPQPYLGIRSLNDLDVQDQYAYLAVNYQGRLCAAATWLWVVDVSEPLTPTLRGDSFVAGGVCSDHAVEIVVQDQQAYIASTTNLDSLAVIEVSNPESPEPVAASNIKALQGFALEGTNLYVPMINEPGIQRYDMSDPANPVLQATYPLLGIVWDTGVRGRYAYAATPAGLVQLDMASPRTPLIRTTLPLAQAHELVIIDDVAYVGHGYNHLTFVDLSVPTEPQARSTIPLSRALTALDTISTTVYLGEGGCCEPTTLLRVVDAGDLQRPQTLATIPVSQTTRDLEATANLLYRLDSAGHFDIFSVSEPTSPTLLNGVTVPEATNFAIANSVAYVAAGAAGVQTIDLSDPQKPALRGAFSTGGKAYDIQVVAEQLYVSNDTTVQVYDRSNPFEPVLLDEIPTSGSGDLVVAGMLVYVAGGYDGLIVLQYGHEIFIPLIHR